AAQWRFRSGDRDVLHLLNGNPEKGHEKDAAPRRYAKLGGSDQVILLSAKLSDRALAEYRGRKPWPALDAAQAEELRILSTGKSFILKKRDDKWTVVGEPDANVNAKAVTDTLDALASLKALRYVADAKADPQLYGLQPPVWTVEVVTPAGKRTLWLGRTEEGSRRFYASVPGTEAVFILSETDGQ